MVKNEIGGIFDFVEFPAVHCSVDLMKNDLDTNDHYEIDVYLSYVRCL